MKLYRDVRTHVYALAYKAEMFYPFDSTQSRNESGSERFKNKKGIFHSNNGRILPRYSDIPLIFDWPDCGWTLYLLEKMR